MVFYEMQNECNKITGEITNCALKVEKCLEHSALPSQVSSWLVTNRFSAYLASFLNFDGRDMLRLSREETIALCGPGDGIRLFNSLHRCVENHGNNPDNIPIPIITF